MTGGEQLGELVRTSSILVCAGSGGVGKTTTAAVLAMEGARQGRRAVVVTIDPAKRLADALGLEGLTNAPSQISGSWPGELWAVMLDTKGTFDALVRRHAPSAEQAESILENRFYRNISGALSGTQEYMAMEKLYELHEEHDFDLVVVDTPPTRHALDFLEAPRTLTRFLEHRIFRLVTAPTRGLVKAMNLAAQTFFRSISRVVGSEVIDDALAFFSAFEGMEEGFKQRAHRVGELLAADTTSFVLVTSPRRDAVSEARFFATQLDARHLAVRGLVINRVHPVFFPGSHEATRARAATLAGTDLGRLYSNLADFQEVAAHEEHHLEGITSLLAGAGVARVPYLPTDVHDLDGLAGVADHLFGRSSTA